ncbi:MAG: galactose mutarotase [Saprospiraceae bacterium]|nr:galactose mutarotase [Candidatus Vicinibacter affinis]MBP6174536.1 galactose mutarotase [Saprospiraceae bacterium]MBK6574132.1 galactose mutarotase [Candidatus Vicinibacter affinis]MBK7302378.1 galactose mutarotase [Candidatus Vicinibacter affinis]MBK7695710.1 galactose mutarotase [Candidatus Vicinibacter affinis]
MDNLQKYHKKSDDKIFSSHLIGDPNGFHAIISNYGAKLISLFVPDAHGQLADVVAGYDTIEEYLKGCPYYGAICGRYANRIAYGKFSLGMKKYQLDTNLPPHMLHGGSKGIQSHVWAWTEQTEKIAALKLGSPDGDMGFPGSLEITIKYSIESDHSLLIEYQATSDQDTVINLATHSYFNLRGKGDILNHRLQISAHQITEIDQDCIPTGRLISITDTPLDFRKEKEIGSEINSGHSLMRWTNGYDHNFVLDEGNHQDKQAAVLSDLDSGRRMIISTSQPGLQLYTCNWGADTDAGKNGSIYQARSFVCLEPQHFPDSPNHSAFPDTTLKVGDTYQHWCRYRFENFKTL